MSTIKLTTEEKAHQAEQNDFPDLDDAGLASRLRQSVNTLRSWRSRNPSRLPPGVQIGRVWLYDKKVVEEWLAAKRGGTPLSSAKKSLGGSQADTKRRGKPSKKEADAAKTAGLTVPSWRVRQAGGRV